MNNEPQQSVSSNHNQDDDLLDIPAFLRKQEENETISIWDRILIKS